MEGEPGEGRSLSETPNWAVATVITVMVVLGFFFQGSLKRCGKVQWPPLSLPLLLKSWTSFGCHCLLCFSVCFWQFFTTTSDVLLSSPPHSLSNSGCIKPRENLYLLPWTKSRKVSSWGFRDRFRLVYLIFLAAFGILVFLFDSCPQS